MIGADVVKIKAAKFQENNEDVEIIVLMYNERCKKLKEGLKEKWFIDFKDQAVQQTFLSFEEFMEQNCLENKDLKSSLQRIGEVKNGERYNS